MARSIAFREALREAMSEEMRRDDRVFLMGEEVAEYNGAYKVSQGMLAEFGPRRIIDTPISELGFAAVGVLWAIKTGQFDDLEGPAQRILMDDDDPMIPFQRLKSDDEANKIGQ